MLTRPLQALLPLCLTSLAAAQGVGSLLPPVKLQDFSQTEATAFADFFGRATLLEFFTYWSRPCTAQVPHMNELHDRFADRGLSVVGVTSESEEDTLAWVEEHGVEYPFAYDPLRKLANWVGVIGVPHAVLVDANGLIVWRGHPHLLTDEVIQSTLTGTLSEPIWTWPPETEGLREQLVAGRLHEALRSAGELGVPYPDIVRGRVGSMMKLVREASEAGDFLLASVAAERFQKQLGQLPEADELARVSAEIEGDSEKQRIIEGQREVAALGFDSFRVRKPSHAEALIERLQRYRERYADTFVVIHAERVIADLETRFPRR